MARPARYSLSALSWAALLFLTSMLPLPSTASAMEAVGFQEAVTRALSNNAVVQAAGEETISRKKTLTWPAGSFSLPSDSMKNSSARLFPRKCSRSSWTRRNCSRRISPT